MYKNPYKHRLFDGSSKCSTRPLSILYSSEKGRDLTQSYDKSPYTDTKIQKATWKHRNATKNFDYTTIADRLRTVSWDNDSYPCG